MFSVIFSCEKNSLGQYIHSIIKLSAPSGFYALDLAKEKFGQQITSSDVGYSIAFASYGQEEGFSFESSIFRNTYELRFTDSEAKELCKRHKKIEERFHTSFHINVMCKAPFPFGSDREAPLNKFITISPFLIEERLKMVKWIARINREELLDAWIKGNCETFAVIF